MTTAKDFIWDRCWGRDVPQELIEMLLIDFAKYHVEQALQGTLEYIDITEENIEQVNNILNSYSLENIK